ncbi:hypothetical protein EHW12_12135 [Rhodococcus sp. NJ-530]|nr:hypothetical protein EHW12_12135 [Rhodococcus sp. NJ-530]
MQLDEYVKIGLLRSQTNSAGTLTIYVYTETTQFDRLWNSVTRQARGLVLDNKSRCIIKCLPKFFNDNEPEALLEKPRDLDPTQLVVQDKVDGSLIQVANDPEYGLVVTSKGSFASDQAMWAREIIDEQYPPSVGYFEPGFTYIFELIHPDNRIVIDYGDRRELILLAVVENDTGKERDIYSKRFLSFDRVAKLDPSTVDNVEALNDKGLSEGVVVNFGGYRVKIKTAEYLRLHRIVTDFTPKRVWEALSNGTASTSRTCRKSSRRGSTRPPADLEMSSRRSILRSGTNTSRPRRCPTRSWDSAPISSTRGRCSCCETTRISGHPSGN